VVYKADGGVHIVPQLVGCLVGRTKHQDEEVPFLSLKEVFSRLGVLLDIGDLTFQIRPSRFTGVPFLGIDLIAAYYSVELRLEAGGVYKIICRTRGEQSGDHNAVHRLDWIGNWNVLDNDFLAE
jgi:hypothetical protein